MRHATTGDPLAFRRGDAILPDVYEAATWQHQGLAPESALADLRAVLGASGKASGNIFAEINTLAEWGSQHGLCLEGGTAPGICGTPGVEHEIVFDAARQRVLKITNPGSYGNTLRNRDGKIGLGPATPLEYLRRWELSNLIFEDDARVLGIVAHPHGARIVIAQPLVVGRRPTREEIGAFMAEVGFAPAQDSLFFRSGDLILVGDAHPGNFLRNDAGQVFAIDAIPADAKGDLLEAVMTQLT